MTDLASGTYLVYWVPAFAGMTGTHARVCDFQFSHSLSEFPIYGNIRNEYDDICQVAKTGLEVNMVIITRSGRFSFNPPYDDVMKSSRRIYAGFSWQVLTSLSYMSIFHQCSHYSPCRKEVPEAGPNGFPNVALNVLEIKKLF